MTRRHKVMDSGDDTRPAAAANISLHRNIAIDFIPPLPSPHETRMSHPALAPLGAAIVLALALPAHAQTAPAGATDLDAVIVTGTRATDRTALESTSPIDVLTAEDIRKAGVLNGELGSAL